MHDVCVLVERGQNGDRIAYNHLIQRFQKMVILLQRVILCKIEFGHKPGLFLLRSIVPDKLLQQE